MLVLDLLELIKFESQVGGLMSFDGFVMISSKCFEFCH